MEKGIPELKAEFVCIRERENTHSQTRSSSAGRKTVAREVRAFLLCKHMIWVKLRDLLMSGKVIMCPQATPLQTPTFLNLISC